jgi:hypothetical protein
MPVAQQPIALSKIESQLGNPPQEVKVRETKTEPVSFCCCSFLQSKRSSKSSHAYIVRVAAVGATVANLRRPALAPAVCTITYDGEERVSALSSDPEPHQISFIGREDLVAYYQTVRPDGGVDIDRIYEGIAKGVHTPESICEQLQKKYGEVPKMRYKSGPCPQLQWKEAAQPASNEFRSRKRVDRLVLTLCGQDGKAFAHASVDLADLRRNLDERIKQPGAIERAVKRTGWYELLPADGTKAGGGAIKVSLQLSTQALEPATRTS